MASRICALVACLASIGCARDYPVPALVPLPPLEPDGVRAFRGELFVTTGHGVQRLDGDLLRTELEVPPALETLHHTGERLWLARRDTSLGWGSAEVIHERRDDGTWHELPLEGLLVTSAVTRGDEAWIASIEGLGSDAQEAHLSWWHDGSLDDLALDADAIRVFSTSAGVLVTTRRDRTQQLYLWESDRLARVDAPHGWSDDPLLALAETRLHAVLDHRLIDVLDGTALPEPPPIQDDGGRNAGVVYREDEPVLLVQDWVVDAGGFWSGARSYHRAQIDRLEGGSWAPVARVDMLLQSAFWLEGDTLVVCDPSACWRAVAPAR